MTKQNDRKPHDALQFYRGRSVLVTGGASFIGSHLAELLVAAGAHVAVCDDLSSGELTNLASIAPQIEFLRGDLRDSEIANKACRSRELVFHLAASHGGRGYIESHPVECVNNMVLDHSVFAAASRAGARKIVFASSACTYPVSLQESASSRNLLREDDAGFESPGKAFADGEYGWAKLMGELQLRAFHKQYGLDAIACRIFTAYGERENETHAVVALIAKAIARLDPFPVWGSGEQTRNFTHVEDTATGLALAGARMSGFDTINLGGSRHFTINALMDAIFAELKWRPSVIERQLDKPVGVQSRASDNTKCRDVLGWEPSVSLEEGLARTVRWYRSRATPERLASLEHSLVERR